MDVITLSLLTALIGVLSLILYTRYKENGQEKTKEIPGYKLSESISGAGVFALSTFLTELHEKFGPIASFYQNGKMEVSIADPTLFKYFRRIEDQPTELKDIMAEFEVLLGKDYLEYMMNLSVEKQKVMRKKNENHFMLKGVKSYSEIFIEIAHEYAERWKQLGLNEKLPLTVTIAEASMKAILRTSFGDYFKDEDSWQNFSKLMGELTTAMGKKPAPNSPEEEEIKKKGEEIRDIATQIVKDRKKETDRERYLYIDVLLEDEDREESNIAGDCVLFINAGQENTGKILMWTIYELAANLNIQEKLYKELKSVLGDEPVTLERLPDLKYLSQLIDESLRIRMPNLFSMRTAVKEMRFDGYYIPANTNLYFASGIICNDPKYFPDHEKYDPEHFSAERVKSRNPYVFKPFGFAAGHQCPAQSFARIQISYMLAEWCRKFKFHLVAGQDVKMVGPMYKPANEIWVTLEPRS